MAQDILITPGSGEPQILFRGSGTNDTPIELNVLSSYLSANGSGSALLFEGTEGQLFAITDNLSSGVIFSVADIAGLPLIEADASGDVQLIEYGRYVGVGTGTPAYQLDVFGTGRFSDGIIFPDGVTQTIAYTGQTSEPTGTPQGLAFFDSNSGITNTDTSVLFVNSAGTSLSAYNDINLSSSVNIGEVLNLFYAEKGAVAAKMVYGFTSTSQGSVPNGSAGVKIYNGQYYGWTDLAGGYDESPNLVITRDDDDILAQRRGSGNPQEFRLYHSDSSASNYSRLSIKATGNNYEISPQVNGDTAGSVIITNDTSTAETLIVRGAASQSANLQEWQNSAGTAKALVTNAGNISGNNISFGNGTTQTTAFEVGGEAGQFQYNDGGTGLAGSDGFTYGGQTTGNILEVQTTGGDTLFYVDNDGNISGSAVATFGSGALLLGTGVVFEVQNTGGTSLFAVEDSTEVQVIVAAQVGQTSFPFEVRDEFDLTAASIDVSGNISGNDISFGDGTTQTTAAGPASVITDAGTGITIVCATHANSYLRTTSNSGVTITFPSGVGCDTNSEFTFEQAGSGQITVTGDAGVTINTSSTTKSYTQFSVISLKQVATDTYTLFGDTASF
jgi:hypothetical protein